MVTFLGNDPIKPDDKYVNVYVSYDAYKVGAVGAQATKVNITIDSFLTQFSDVKPGDQVAINVRWGSRSPRDNEKIYYPYFTF